MGWGPEEDERIFQTLEQVQVWVEEKSKEAKFGRKLKRSSDKSKPIRALQIKWLVGWVTEFPGNSGLGVSASLNLWLTVAPRKWSFSMEVRVLASELSSYSMAVTVMYHFLLQIPVKVCICLFVFKKLNHILNYFWIHVDMLCIFCSCFWGFFHILIEFVILSYSEKQQCFTRISYSVKLTLFFLLNKFCISGRLIALKVS